MEEYLKILLEQIRCKKAHGFIENEIRGHIEDQYEANLFNGMSEDEAMREAIRDMGNPVETGIALDKIHRPAIAWDIIILMAIISLVGIIIHLFIGDETQASQEFILYTIVGFVIMLIIYRLDYSFIASYAKFIAFTFILLLFLSTTGFTGVLLNGATLWIDFPFFNVSIYALMMFYVPVYGAVIYQYYGSGLSGILKSLLWMIIPVLLVTTLPSPSLTIILFFAMAILLSLAVCKGWFRVSPKHFLVPFWGILLTLPVLLLTIAMRMNWLAAYQQDRIHALITGGYNNSFINNLLHTFLSRSRWIGGDKQVIAENLPDFNSSFILTYLTSGYGILVGLFVCTLLALLTLKIFSISFKQQNQLGMVMGCGCGLVFSINILQNIFQNIGLLPFTSQSFLPFFSTGGSCLIISYALMGIILSIYRYKNLLPTLPPRGRISISIKLNL